MTGSLLVPVTVYGFGAEGCPQPEIRLIKTTAEISTVAHAHSRLDGIAKMECPYIIRCRRFKYASSAVLSNWSVLSGTKSMSFCWQNFRISPVCFSIASRYALAM